MGLLDQAKNQATLGKYITKNQKQISEIMEQLFYHFNELGKIDESGKLQITYLTTILSLFVTKSGIPKQSQKEIVEGLLKSL